jgi:hypothetical protein
MRSQIVLTNGPTRIAASSSATVFGGVRHRIQVLERTLSLARAEINALRVALDVSVRSSVWGRVGLDDRRTAVHRTHR